MGGQTSEEASAERRCDLNPKSPGCSAGGNQQNSRVDSSILNGSFSTFRIGSLHVGGFVPELVAAKIHAGRSLVCSEFCQCYFSGLGGRRLLRHTGRDGIVTNEMACPRQIHEGRLSAVKNPRPQAREQCSKRHTTYKPKQLLHELKYV